MSLEDISFGDFCAVTFALSDSAAYFGAFAVAVLYEREEPRTALTGILKINRNKAYKKLSGETDWTPDEIVAFLRDTDSYDRFVEWRLDQEAD